MTATLPAYGPAGTVVEHVDLDVVVVGAGVTGLTAATRLAAAGRTVVVLEARENVALFVAEAMLTKPAHTFSLLQALLMAASAGVDAGRVRRELRPRRAHPVRRAAAPARGSH